MTDNEKAARFIGFVPGPCRGVPDMADPRNYMKALEAVRVTGVYYPEILTNGIGWLMRFGKVLGPPLEDGEPFTMPRIAKSHAVLGSAVIKALAALYDIEHSRIS